MKIHSHRECQEKANTTQVPELMMKFLELLFCLQPFVRLAVGIVNPNDETARMVIYLQKPNDLGPRTWIAGVNCLDSFTKIYFKKEELMTRTPNVVLTSFLNMSTPAAQIQESYLKLMMGAVSEMSSTNNYYQLRIISDAKRYSRIAMSQRELVLADYYTIITDSLHRLRKIMRHYISYSVSWNPGARFLVLYNNVNNRNRSMETAREIFEEMLYNFYVHHVTVIYATTPTRYSLLLMDYYNHNACRQLNVKSFAVCEEGRLRPGNLNVLEKTLQAFLNKIKLNNCTFYMCASIAAPFVEADCTYGLELRIIGFIKNRLKFNVSMFYLDCIACLLSIPVFSLKVNQTCERESRGVEDEDSGNFTGLLGRLNEKSCDFIMGGFYPDNDVIKRFWVSDCYFSDSYTWFVKLADPRPAWMALYAIFKNLTWLSFILMLLITWITWFILVYFLPEPSDTREFSLIGINSMAVSICVSVNERPMCGATRIFFVFLAIYGLNVTSTYTSKLISVFTNPGYLHQIDNLKEVKDAGIPYGKFLWVFFLFNFLLHFDL